MAAGVYETSWGDDPYGDTPEARPEPRHVLAGQWRVGVTLREARVAGGETLEDVAEAIRIPADYLLAIEEENYYGLPGWAHAVGYVRSYALYLGLDSGPLVKRVRDQLALREHVFAQHAAVNSIRLTRLLSVGGTAALVIAVVAGLYFAVPLATVTAFLAPLPEKIFSVFPGGDRPSPVASAPRLAAKADAGAAAPVGLGAPVTPVVITQFAPAEAAEPAIRAMAISPERAPSAGPGPGVFVLQPLPRHSVDRGSSTVGEVTLRASKPTWFRVEDRRGGVIAERNLARGEVHQLPDVSDLVIMTRDAGAIEYYVDGRLGGRLGGDGQSISGISLANLAARPTGG